MYSVPSTPDLLKQTSVPFALVLSPFAPAEEGEIEPPVSDFGPTGPVRWGAQRSHFQVDIVGD